MSEMAVASARRTKLETDAKNGNKKAKAALELADIIKRDDGSYIVDGRYSFYDFLAYFDKEDLFDEDISFNTISGLIIDILKEIPKEGQKIKWHDFTFEIMDMDAARIDKVLVIL